MNAVRRQSLLLLCCAVFIVAACAQPALASDVGRVLVAAGDTVAIRGSQTVRLATGSAIQDGDALRTGQASNMQVRFIDDSVVSLKESSELRIDNYKFTGKADGSERAYFTLVKGGLRTVTGAIGGKHNKNYRMVTSTATLGVRGTDYTVTLCQMDCRNADGTAVRDGLYGRVLGLSHGSNKIVVTGGRDSKVFGINENFFVADDQSPVQRLVAPPAIVPNRLEGRRAPARQEARLDAGQNESTGKDVALTGGVSSESRANPTAEPVTKEQYVATQTLGQEGRSVVALPPRVVAYSSDTGAVNAIIEGNAATINTASNVTAIVDTGTSTGTSTTTCTTCGLIDTVQTTTSVVTTNSVVDAGSIKLVDGSFMYWGRWSGGSVTSQVVGTTTVTSPADGGPFVIADNVIRLPLLGSFVYSLAGGPSVVDASGNVGGQITQGAFKVGFGVLQSISVVTPLAFAVGGESFTLTSACGGACSFLLPTTSMSMSLDGVCSGGACGSSAAASANATGLLVGTQAGGLSVVGTVSSPAPAVTFAGAFKR